MKQALKAIFPYMYSMGYQVNNGEPFEVEEPVLILQYDDGLRLMLRKSQKGGMTVEKIGRVKFGKLRRKIEVEAPESLWLMVRGWFDGSFEMFFLSD
ncbi:TPA: hypothetical protein DF272_05365 [Candidatus Falkowbacteria bacterium]|nr:hypothetical protein [Candidatus Falkowbacteria bacterium]